MYDVKIFGQSHAPAIGCVIEGLPSGFMIDTQRLHKFMERRAPGKNPYSTKRCEEDIPEFVSGLVGGKTCGAPLCAIIPNFDTRSGDYENIRDIPRPSHADYTAYIKSKGTNDVRGGGQFSGRLTAPLCVAGGIAIQLLEQKGINIYSRIYSIKDICDTDKFSEKDFRSANKKEFPVIDDQMGELMKQQIEDARMNMDSVGGVVECTIEGLPAGLGDWGNNGMEGIISREIFGIPAVKGIEFGSGFYGTRLFGSENNDGFYAENGVVKTYTNNHGGILGGITSGMPITFRTAFKPTPSIGKKQKSVSLSKMENTELEIKGRHDPCIVLRAVPVVEAAAAVSIMKVIDLED